MKLNCGAENHKLKIIQRFQGYLSKNKITKNMNVCSQLTVLHMAESWNDDLLTNVYFLVSLLAMA